MLENNRQIACVKTSQLYGTLTYVVSFGGLSKMGLSCLLYIHEIRAMVKIEALIWVSFRRALRF